MSTISLNVIGRNNEDIIGRMLDSAANHFDEWVYVDTGSTDRTKQVVQEKAEQYGVPLIMEDFIWVQDFAAARNFALQFCSKEWMFWMDTDDVLMDGQHLRQLADNAPPQVGGITLRYDYGHDEYGNCITRLTRERLVRLDRKWRWKWPVHEVLDSQLSSTFAFNPEVWIKHQPTTRPEDNVTRNTSILERYVKEEPDNTRTVMYLGFQYFAESKFGTALEWYEKAIHMDASDEELWHIFTYMARCHIELGQFDLAQANAMQAVAFKPAWADPYFLLAKLCFLSSNWADSIWWFLVGKSAIVPNNVMFLNPLEYNWRPYIYAHGAYFHVGKYEEALTCTEQALKVRPEDKEVKEANRVYKEAVRRLHVADGLIKTAQTASPEERVKLFAGIPNNLLVVQELRDALMPDVHADWMKRADGRKRVVFFCGPVFEPWGPPSLDKGGIGGSETAVIHMARQLANLGHHVTVFNECGIYEGIHDNVGYFSYREFEHKEDYDLLISWRQPQLVDVPRLGAKKVWLWAHDLHYREELTPARATKFDRIMPVSKWHEDYLHMVYPFLGENLRHTTNGVDLTRFVPNKDLVRDPKKVVYVSSPDRGLIPLLEMWRYLSAIEGTSLHVFYGFNNMRDMANAGNAWARGELSEIERRVALTKNVHLRGRLGQKELAKEMMSAGVWLYPTDFLEVSCISAMEAMAAGLACVTSNLGALPETTGDWGLKVTGWPRNATYQKQFMAMASELLNNQELRKFTAQEYMVEPPTWWQVAKEWASCLL